MTRNRIMIGSILFTGIICAVVMFCFAAGKDSNSKAPMMPKDQSQGEASIIPAWQKGDLWEVQVYLRADDQLQQSGNPEENRKLLEQGFVNTGKRTFEVIEISKEDGTASIDVTDSGGVGCRVNLSKEGVRKKVAKLKVDYFTGERKVSDLTEDEQDSYKWSYSILPREIAYPDTKKIKDLEKSAQENGIELITIKTEVEGATFLWERGLPWWRKQFFTDERGAYLKAYLTKCHCRGKEISFSLPSDISKRDEDITKSVDSTENANSGNSKPSAPDGGKTDPPSDKLANP